MDGVIVEYKNECRIRLIEQSIERRTRQRALILKRRIIEVNTITFRHGVLIPIRNTNIFFCKPYKIKRSWKHKHTGKRAPNKQYERHPHRIKDTPCGRGLFVSIYA